MKGNGDFSIGQEVWPGLGKLVEEMGELNQVLGKLIGSEGKTNHFDGTDLSIRLKEEIADVHAALIFFCNRNDISIDSIAGRSTHKHHQFCVWHEEGLQKRDDEFRAEQQAKEFPYG